MRRTVVIFFLLALAGCAEFDRLVDQLGRVDRLGRVWNVNDGGWTGTWTRRGSSDRFDAVWRNPSSGQEVRDEIVFESITGNQIVLYRTGMKGRYRGNLSTDRTMVENGTADWYPPGVTWSATITR